VDAAATMQPQDADDGSLIHLCDSSTTAIAIPAMEPVADESRDAATAPASVMIQSN